MKIADPDRGWRKFHDDIKRKRKLTLPNEQPPQQQQQPPIQQPYQQPYRQPQYQPQNPTPIQPQPQSTPPNVTYNVNPPQTTQGNVQVKKSRLGLFILSIIIFVAIAFLLQPEQTIGVFQAIGERITTLWETVQGVMQ